MAALQPRLVVVIMQIIRKLHGRWKLDRGEDMVRNLYTISFLFLENKIVTVFCTYVLHIHLYFALCFIYCHAHFLCFVEVDGKEFIPDWVFVFIQ